ncbi:MAG: hypothetical protein II816_03530, partial [Elusimicrobia bacterium]|nr:hypothetical protein [Elusimicrobiota bacterium]
NYEQSNSAFEQAKRIYDQNYTKSISAGTFSLFANDNVIPYYGHPYEISYTNVICALNYVLQGQNNEAVVEARQVDNLFKKINADSFGKAFYNDDPFVKYFMGIIYENAGYYNDALISYKSALKNYDTGIYVQTQDAYHEKKEKKNIGYSLSAPKDLIYRLFDLYDYLGFSAEAAELKNKFSFLFINREKPAGNCGELIVINYNGLSPKKVDSVIEIAFSKAWIYFNAESVTSKEQDDVGKVRSAVAAGFSSDYIKVAFPKYEKYNNKISSFSIEEIDEQEKTSLQKEYFSFATADMGTLMTSALQRENLAIYSKTIARAVGRYVLAKVVVDQVRQQDNNKSGGWASVLTQATLNIANSMLEKADKRSWRTLPEKINMARIYIPEGTHTFNIKYMDAFKNVVYTEKMTTEIKKGKKTFVITKSYKG